MAMCRLSLQFLHFPPHKIVSLIGYIVSFQQRCASQHIRLFNDDETSAYLMDNLRLERIFKIIRKAIITTADN